MITLASTDVNILTLEVIVLQLCVRTRFGDRKHTTSQHPFPLQYLVFDRN